MTAHAYETMTITDRVDMSLTLAPSRPWQEKWYEAAGYLADLKICDALVQVIKHHTRQNSALMTARISRIAGISAGTTVAIAWRASSRAPEQEVDALALARRCVAAWVLFFIQEGLSVSE